MSKNAPVVYAGNGRYDFWIPDDSGIVTNLAPDPAEYLNGESITYLGGCFKKGEDFAKEAKFWGNWPSETEPFPLEQNDTLRIHTLDDWIRAVSGWGSPKNGYTGAYLQRVRSSLDQHGLVNRANNTKIILIPK